MDKMMDNPWFFRITALLLAMLLFFTVKSGVESNSDEGSNMTDVIQEIPVEVYYDDDNLFVTGVPRTIDMKISGPRSIVLPAKALQDFTVFVDLRNLSMGEHEVRIQHENVSDKLEVELSPATTTVNIEERISMEFDVEPEINERLLETNFVIKNLKSDPEQIRVTGPKSVIENIEFVKATVKGEKGINESFTREANIRVLDINLGKLENVTIEPEQVNVTVEVEEYSEVIPIKLRQKGSPKEGVTINELTADVMTVRAFGNKGAIDELEEIIIDVDVSELETSDTLTIKVPVPKGVSRLAEKEIKVRVDVTPAPVEDEGTEDAAQAGQEDANEDPNITSRELADMNVEVRGLNDADRYSFIQPDNGQLILTIKGENSLIGRLSASDFQVYVDASDAKTGDNQLEVIVTGPKNVTWTVSSPITTVQVERA